MKASVAILTFVGLLGLSAPAYATALTYSFSFAGIEGQLTVATVGLLDTDVLIGSSSNAAITDIQITSFPVHLSIVNGLSGGLGLTTDTAQTLHHLNYATISDSGLVSGHYERWTSCELDCVHFTLDYDARGGFGQYFAAYARADRGIIDEEFLYGPVTTERVETVPEPAPLLLLAVSLGGLAVRRQRQSSVSMPIV